MKNFMKYLSLALVTFVLSCSTTKKTTSTTDGPAGDFPTAQDTSLVVEDGTGNEEPQPPYRPARQRDWDLLHTALDLSFDWQKQNVIGVATLKLTPLFYPQQNLAVDADHFKLRKV
jgi:aminopeptidase N